MTFHPSRSSHPVISDELLSAYLDGEVTSAESARVEQAQDEDETVAIRLNLLTETVDLLRQTPRLAVPRPFVLSEAQVLAAGGRVKAARTRAQPAARAGGFWGWLGGLSPRVMPLATAAVALALLLVVGIDLNGNLRPAAAPAPQAAMAPETEDEMAAMGALKAAAEDAQARAAGAEVAAETTPAPESTIQTLELAAPESAAIRSEVAGEKATLKSVIPIETLTPEVAPPTASASPLRLVETALAGLLVLLAALTLLGRRVRSA